MRIDEGNVYVSETCSSAWGILDVHIRKGHDWSERNVWGLYDLIQECCWQLPGKKHHSTGHDVIAITKKHHCVADYVIAITNKHHIIGYVIVAVTNTHHCIGHDISVIMVSAGTRLVKKKKTKERVSVVHSYDSYATDTKAQNITRMVGVHSRNHGQVDLVC